MKITELIFRRIFRIDHLPRPILLLLFFVFTAPALHGVLFLLNHSLDYTLLRSCRTHRTTLYSKKNGSSPPVDKRLYFIRFLTHYSGGTRRKELLIRFKNFEIFTPFHTLRFLHISISHNKNIIYKSWAQRESQQRDWWKEMIQMKTSTHV